MNKGFEVCYGKEALTDWRQAVESSGEVSIVAVGASLGVTEDEIMRFVHTRNGARFVGGVSRYLIWREDAAELERRRFMRWDRFDICKAWFTYCAQYHNGQGSKEYKALGRLHRMGYKNKGYFIESENAKAIYNNLCACKGANIREA